MAKNVLTAFRVTPHEETILEISCRPSGILNYIFTLLKLAPSTTLKASRTSMDFEVLTLFRHETIAAPLNHISTLECGRSRNWAWLLVAVSSFFFGFWNCDSIGTLLLGLLLTALALLFYYLSACFYIGFSPDSGRGYRITFHSSVIGGETVDFNKVRATCNLLRQLVLSAK